MVHLGVGVGELLERVSSRSQRRAQPARTDPDEDDYGQDKQMPGAEQAVEHVGTGTGGPPFADP